VPGRLAAQDKRLIEELGRSEGLKPPAPQKSLFEKVKDAFGG
jgi:hypothetical protein